MRRRHSEREHVTILAIQASARSSGNTTAMLDRFRQGARDAGALVETLDARDLNLQWCRGCLRCNVLQRCALRGDDWPDLSEKILRADTLVFAAPVYFHHVPAALKRVIDRFRSFVHVQMTAEGLRHTPWHPWSSRFVLLLAMGAADSREARPVVDLFSFLTATLGLRTGLETILAGRVAVSGQIRMDVGQLAALYRKMGMPPELAAVDCQRNRDVLQQCHEAGRRAARQCVESQWSVTASADEAAGSEPETGSVYGRDKEPTEDR